VSVFCLFKLMSTHVLFVAIGATNTNYLLTPRSRVLVEKLTGSQLVKKFPAFYGTRRFITTFTSARHLSLS
jgi:hypothetical protein